MMNDALTLTHCSLCPRACGVDRSKGETGFCGAGAAVEIYRYGPHHGEEPPVSGTRGSGTVFFSRCTLRCLYCQNYPWSQEGKGRVSSVEGLASLFGTLADAGCHNLNLVSPTPWLPQVVPVLQRIRQDGIGLPVVYNTSGFERVEILARLEEIVDVYLTDLRYSREATAAEGSGNAAVVTTSRAALLEMWRQKGPVCEDARGTALRGVICRLLVLPGRAIEAIENLRWLAEQAGPGVPVSVMSQYTPAHRAVGTSSWDRRVSRGEYESVLTEMDRLGFANGWVQDFDGETPAELVGYQMAPGDG